MDHPREDLLYMDAAVWVLTAPTGKSVYDFAFDRFLPCRRPYERPTPVSAIARVGAVADYEHYYQRQAEEGVQLIHTPEEHRRASSLPNWYPLIEDLTPRSLWFREPPEARLIEQELGWPIFMKGERQTSHHKKSLAIIEGPEDFERALEAYAQDSILHWQQLVCRRYVKLRPVEETAQDRLPSSFEFRTFWWRGELAGFGRYWWEGRKYEATEAERSEAIALAREAARRVNVPFLVVDVAQDVQGRWLVIECNDGQESGYAGVSPLGLWQAVIRLERQRLSPSVSKEEDP